MARWLQRWCWGQQLGWRPWKEGFLEGQRSGGPGGSSLPSAPSADTGLLPYPTASAKAEHREGWGLQCLHWITRNLWESHTTYSKPSSAKVVIGPVLRKMLAEIPLKKKKTKPWYFLTSEENVHVRSIFSASASFSRIWCDQNVLVVVECLREQWQKRT